MSGDKEKRATFTPGPWVIELGKEHYLIEDEKGGRVALIENWTNATPEANARLIASAPELHTALVWLVADWERCHGKLPVDHEASAVLAKVDGGEG